VFLCYSIADSITTEALEQKKRAAQKYAHIVNTSDLNILPLAKHLNQIDTA